MTTPGSAKDSPEGVAVPWGRSSGNNPPGVTFPGAGLCLLRHRQPVEAEAGLQVCSSHLAGLADSLAEVSLLFGELDELAVPGPSTEEHVRGKPVASKPPLRLEVMVVKDARLVEVVDDTVPVGVLFRWARQLGDERRLQGLDVRDPLSGIARLRLHLRWVASREWVVGFEADLRQFVACLRRLAGDVPRPRVGSCQALVDDVECGGPLLADRYGALGVSCARCGDRWSESELRRLGLILASGGQV